MNRNATIILGAALAAVLCGSAPAAWADGDPTSAAKAFDSAQAASLGGDHARAAELYELADEIVPSPEALRSAAREREQAGHLAVAASHAESLLRRYPDDPKSVALARELVGRLGPALVHVQVGCDPACAMAADGSAVGTATDTRHVFYLRPGSHVLIASFGDGREARYSLSDRDSQAGSSAKVELSAPAPVAVRPATPQVVATPQRSSSKATVWVVGIGSALTVGLAALGTWSGLDTLKARDAFELSPSDDRFRAGRSKQLRTNLLFTATAIAAVGTVVGAVLVHRWVGRHTGVEVKVDPEGAAVAWGRSF